MADESTQVPQPDPSLMRLEKLIGTWIMKGRPVGSDKDSITGMTTFAWLHEKDGRGFFLRQDMNMDYDGMPIQSHEIIGYNPETKAFSSYVFSNMSGSAPIYMGYSR